MVGWVRMNIDASYINTTASLVCTLSFSLEAVFYISHPKVVL